MKCDVRCALLMCGLASNTSVLHAVRQSFEVEHAGSNAPGRSTSAAQCLCAASIGAGVVGVMGYVGTKLPGTPNNVVYDVDQYPEREMECCANMVDYSMRYTIPSPYGKKGFVVDDSAISVSKSFKRFAVCVEKDEGVTGGDDLVCYFPCKTLRGYEPGKAQDVLCIRGANSLVLYLKTILGGFVITTAAMTKELEGMRVTSKGFTCGATRYQCSMNACPAGGFYTGKAIYTQLPGGEKQSPFKWMVALTHPSVTQDSGGFDVTAATVELERFVKKARATQNSSYHPGEMCAGSHPKLSANVSAWV